MDFYSAHIATSNKHLLGFVSVASACKDERIHCLQISSLFVFVGQSSQSYLGRSESSLKMELLIDIYHHQITTSDTRALTWHNVFQGKPNQSRWGEKESQNFFSLDSWRHQHSEWDVACLIYLLWPQTQRNLLSPRFLSNRPWSITLNITV